MFFIFFLVCSFFFSHRSFSLLNVFYSFLEYILFISCIYFFTAQFIPDKFMSNYCWRLFSRKMWVQEIKRCENRKRFSLTLSWRKGWEMGNGYVRKLDREVQQSLWRWRGRCVYTRRENWFSPSHSSFYVRIIDSFEEAN